jgi:hypothetical protein|nr:MAG TPA: Protein of unknown function (DUF3486) [Caudoviricetes sp.]
MGLSEIKKGKKMARKSFITALPKEIVEALHERIRAAEYGDHMAMVEWVKQQGYHASKSAMCRYTLELKARDGYEGGAGSFKLHTQMHSKDSNLEMLYKELGELEYRRQEILNRIRDLMGK